MRSSFKIEERREFVHDEKIRHIVYSGSDSCAGADCFRLSRPKIAIIFLICFATETG